MNIFIGFWWETKKKLQKSEISGRISGRNKKRDQVTDPILKKKIMRNNFLFGLMVFMKSKKLVCFEVTHTPKRPNYKYKNQ